MSTHHTKTILSVISTTSAQTFSLKKRIREYNVSFICVTLQQIIPHRITKTDEKATPFVSQNRRIENLLVSQKETGKNLSTKVRESI